MRSQLIRIIFVAGVLICAGALLAQSEPAAAPAANLNQLMRGLFFPLSNAVFAGQRVNPAEIPRAPEPSAASDPLTGVFGGWAALENSALTLIDGADLLMTPGRTCSNGREVPVKAADWAKFVDQLRDAGKAAYKAAQSKSMERILEASDTLATSCSNCHNRYRRASRCQ
jgi:hypothetical protein